MDVRNAQHGNGGGDGNSPHGNPAYSASLASLSAEYASAQSAAQASAAASSASSAADSAASATTTVDTDESTPTDSSSSPTATDSNGEDDPSTTALSSPIPTAPTTLETSIILSSPTTIDAGDALASSAYNPSETPEESVVSSQSTLSSTQAAITASMSGTDGTTTVIPLIPSRHTPGLSPGQSGDPDTYGPPVEARHHNNSYIAAAVVVPLLVALGLLGFLFFFLRNRRRRKAVQPRPMEEVRAKIHPAPTPPMAAAAASEQPHLGTSPDNPTYFTGLDTESAHSGGHDSLEEPPPPYVRSANSSMRRPLGAAPMIPRLQIDRASSINISPFADSHSADSPYQETSNLRRPEVSRETSNRSITSTLYSSNASVNEAEPARVSTSHARLFRHSLGAERSPFADP